MSRREKSLGKRSLEGECSINSFSPPSPKKEKTHSGGSPQNPKIKWKAAVARHFSPWKFGTGFDKKILNFMKLFPLLLLLLSTYTYIDYYKWVRILWFVDFPSPSYVFISTTRTFCPSSSWLGLVATWGLSLTQATRQPRKYRAWNWISVAQSLNRASLEMAIFRTKREKMYKILNELSKNMTANMRESEYFVFTASYSSFSPPL